MSTIQTRKPIEEMSDDELNRYKLMLEDKVSRSSKIPRFKGLQIPSSAQAIDPEKPIEEMSDDELDQYKIMLQQKVSDSRKILEFGGGPSTVDKAIQTAQDFATGAMEGVSFIGTPTIAGISAKVGEWFGEQELQKRLNVSAKDIEDVELGFEFKNVRDTFEEAFTDRETLVRMAKDRSPFAANIGEALGFTLTFGKGAIGRAISKKAAAPMTKFAGGGIKALGKTGAGRAKIARGIGEGLAFGGFQGLGRGTGEAIGSLAKGEDIKFAPFIEDALLDATGGALLPIALRASEPLQRAFGRVVDKIFYKLGETFTGVPADLAEVFVRDQKEVVKLIKQLIDTNDPGAIQLAQEFGDDIYKVLQRRYQILNKMYGQAIEDASAQMFKEPFVNKGASDFLELKDVVDAFEKMMKKGGLKKHLPIEGEMLSWINSKIFQPIKKMGKEILRRSKKPAGKLMKQKGLPGGTPFLKNIRSISDKNFRDAVNFYRPTMNVDELLAVRKLLGKLNRDYYRILSEKEAVLFEKKRLGSLIDSMYKNINEILEEALPTDAIRRLDGKFQEMYELDKALRPIFRAKAPASRVFGLRTPSNELMPIVKKLDDIIGGDLIHEAKMAGIPIKDLPKDFARRSQQITAARFFHPQGPGSELLAIDKTGKSAARMVAATGMASLFKLVGASNALVGALGAAFSSPLMFKQALKARAIPESLLRNLGGSYALSNTQMDVFVQNLFARAFKEYDRNQMLNTENKGAQ